MGNQALARPSGRRSRPFDAPGHRRRPRSPSRWSLMRVWVRELLSRWRDADRAGSDSTRWIVAAGSASSSSPTPGERRPPCVSPARGRDAVLGLRDGPRRTCRTPPRASAPPSAPASSPRWSSCARQGSDAFVRHGIAQMTRGGIDEDTAQKDGGAISLTWSWSRRPWRRSATEPEPIGDELRGHQDLPLLLREARRLPRQHRRGVRGHRQGIPRAPRQPSRSMNGETRMTMRVLRHRYRDSKSSSPSSYSGALPLLAFPPGVRWSSISGLPHRWRRTSSANWRATGAQRSGRNALWRRSRW